MLNVYICNVYILYAMSDIYIYFWIYRHLYCINKQLHYHSKNNNKFFISFTDIIAGWCYFHDMMMVWFRWHSMMDPHVQSPSRVDPRKQALLEGRLSGRGKVWKTIYSQRMKKNLFNCCQKVLWKTIMQYFLTAMF